jgi:hypothetical protein
MTWPIKVVDEEIIPIRLDLAFKKRLIREPLKPARSRVANGIRLHYHIYDRQPEPLRQKLCQRYGNLIHTFGLQCMHRQERYLARL